MNGKENILNAWIMVEHLSEGDINVRDQSLKMFENLENEDYYTLLLNQIKKKKFNQYQKGGVVLYFEIFKFEEVVSVLRKKYHLEPTDEDIRVGDKFSFALCFDKNLNLCDEMTFLTISAYIRWHKEIVSRNVFREYEAKFKLMISQLFEEEDDKKSGFNKAIRELLTRYNVEIQNCRMQIVNNIETDATNLHSFFVDDLEKAKLIRTENLGSYLLGKRGKRINLDSKNDSVNFNPDAFCDILQPKYYPIARFPSNTEFSLSLMQQVAVNLSIGYDNKQIRSVNGPPGTGKTTLLKDIFAELVVEQAFDIANLSKKVIKGNANTIYYENASIGELPTLITEKGIMVASSNNSAVQNIVNEIPLIKDIDKKLVEELKAADYFTRISNSKLSTKWIEEGGKKKPQLIMEDIPGEDKFWGLFSLEGGKADNMANIITSLNHIVEYLDKEYISDDDVYEEFIKLYNFVDNKKEQMQIYVVKREEYKAYCKCLEQLKYSYLSDREMREKSLGELIAECKEYGDKLCADIERLQKYQRDIEERKATNERNRQSLEICIQSLREQKPFFLAPRKAKREYKTRLEEINQQLLECVNESNEITKEKGRGEHSLQELQNEHETLMCKQQREQLEFDKWVTKQEEKISIVEHQCAVYKKELDGKMIKNLDMNLEYEELQESNPWFDEEYRIAQSKLFILALRVRKQFLYENRKNIKAATIIWNKQDEYLNQKHIIVAAWNWINMAIPVISSTFASFSRMCKNIDAEMLGHLFIDEAGQALPQASVGAIFRSKHVMVVGDPLQIKPVLTLDSNVLNMLGEHFEVSKRYLSNTVSTQTLVDEISQYGFYKGHDDWIGIPLWVHRRCKYPMFTISNKISYDGLMVQGKPGDGKAEWCDIGGTANNKYVKEQGEFLVQKIKEMIQENPKIIDKNEKDIIYVITPFSNVAYHLTQVLKQIHFTRYDEHGKPTNVGTIHTFQGKEAPIVFLVLGADKNSSGAASWAVREPNMMNVAATRAKEEFYVIGDKSLYLKCDVAKDTYKIIEQYKKSI